MLFGDQVGLHNMIYIIRHGQTLLNREMRYQGHIDSALTPLGQGQALAIAHFLAPLGLTRIFSSDLGRAVATAEATARMTGLDILPDARLRELYFGSLEGLTYDQAMVTYGCAVTCWYNNLKTGRPPGGESLTELHSRIECFLREIASINKDIAIFTHGGVCNLLYSLSTATSLSTNHWSTPGDIYSYEAKVQDSKLTLKLYGVKQWELS